MPNMLAVTMAVCSWYCHHPVVVMQQLDCKVQALQVASFARVARHA
jgi:hypothetical protein